MYDAIIWDSNGTLLDDAEVCLEIVNEMVGDTFHDAELARRLGLGCVLIAAGHESFSRLGSQGFCVVETFEDLSRVLRSGRPWQVAARRPTRGSG